MDEKGIQLGIGKRVLALTDRDQKSVQQVENGNRELLTIIECVCADGTVIRPAVIFQAKRRKAEWGRHNPCQARYDIDSVFLFYELTSFTAYLYLKRGGPIRSSEAFG